MLIFIVYTVCFCFAADYRFYGSHMGGNCSYEATNHKKSLPIDTVKKNNFFLSLVSSMLHFLEGHFLEGSCIAPFYRFFLHSLPLHLHYILSFNYLHSGAQAIKEKKEEPWAHKARHSQYFTLNAFQE